MPYIYRITRRSRKATVKAIPASLSRQERATQVLQQRVAEARDASNAKLSTIAAKNFAPTVKVVNSVSISEIQRKIAASKPSYRDLQAEAKALGIPGKQKAGTLRKAIREAKRNPT